MALLITGLVIFFAIHLLPSIRPLRSSLFGFLGENGYKASFSIFAAVGFVLIVVGKAKAEFVSCYLPPTWGRSVAPILMWFAFVLLPAAHMPGNIKRITRHPMLWGVLLWSVAHLLANGDLASIVLFGGFAVFSVFSMVSANLRGAKLQQQGHPLKKDLMVLVAGTVVYFAILFLHPYLFGVAVV